MQEARRTFLLEAARLTAAASAGAAFSLGAAAAEKSYPFSLGVASGSPLPHSVILWTRILPDPLNAASSSPLALAVRWEVAVDEAFRRVVAKGSAVASPLLAHSVHVDAGGLRPDRPYWYRFMLGDAVSPVGRTRTAPAPYAMPSKLKLVVASCQHWEFGHYAAHRQGHRRHRGRVQGVGQNARPQDDGMGQGRAGSHAQRKRISRVCGSRKARKAAAAKSRDARGLKQETATRLLHPYGWCEISDSSGGSWRGLRSSPVAT